MSKGLLITGASRGIGAATATLAAAQGYSICLNYHKNESAAAELLDSITASGCDAFTFQADVSEEADVLAMFAAIDERFGCLHGLVNNAGILENQAEMVDMSVARWRRVFDTNVIGSFLCAREAARSATSPRRVESRDPRESVPRPPLRGDRDWSPQRPAP